VQATRDIASTLARVDAIPDALIIDRSLPDGDGRDLIEGLRARAIDASALFIVDGDAPADAPDGRARRRGVPGPPFAVADAVRRIRGLLCQPTPPRQSRSARCASIR
jgi:two-component system, OmpR family, copper resistance phosphate regulon response regulator CusR